LAARLDENKAVSRADIIVTATNSFKPIFNGKYLKPGVHINAIGNSSSSSSCCPSLPLTSVLASSSGSYSPSMQELDETTVQGAKVRLTLHLLSSLPSATTTA
jgi:ornithine cyclodeaminase/alanine dehydrogenase-like protein (mu-crystallin family)